MLRSIPEVKSTIIFPLSNNIELCDELSKLLLGKKLKSCDEATKQLPDYLDALRVIYSFKESILVLCSSPAMISL